MLFTVGRRPHYLLVASKSVELDTVAHLAADNIILMWVCDAVR